MIHGHSGIADDEFIFCITFAIVIYGDPGALDTSSRSIAMKGV